ncbi:unnamed protein product [Nesidiocoris tenuis]|uniref:Uncharacterized protein n=1 Tax=Nesidiocoris tenuis TaxID=355587 RepID=A0A6H5HB15_9HEMI|nr:unnamed protein product [Nesidiocoris tenuis]
MIKRPRHRRQAQGSFLNVFVYFSDHHLAVSDKRGSPHHRIRLPVHTNDKRNHERQFKRKNNCDGRYARLRFNKRDEPTVIVGACIVLQHTIFTKKMNLRLSRFSWTIEKFSRHWKVSSTLARMSTLNQLLKSYTSDSPSSEYNQLQDAQGEFRLDSYQVVMFERRDRHRRQEIRVAFRRC